MTTAVVIAAAGSGTRLGAALPKAFVAVAGESILRRSLRAALSTDAACVVVAAPADAVDAARTETRDLGDPRVSVVAGGATRQRSVAAALAALPSGVDVVLVHDAARALAPRALFDRVEASVREHDAGVVPVLRVIDTIKRVDESGVVQDTVDRESLRVVQTPQGFPASALLSAYADAADEHTDDAALFARAGHPVTTVQGDGSAFKITTAEDLERAERLLSAAAPAIRTGVGVDAHAFDAEAPMHLGGVFWPDEPGLAGHSDGDVVCHAIADALLAAAGAGDLGAVFGTDRPEEAGRPGTAFVRRVAALLAERGWRPLNVSVQVIGNRPRVAVRRAEIETVLADAVGAPVAVSGTTTDGMGFTGHGEGVAAIATVLIARR